jgi:hypothetical protein
MSADSKLMVYPLNKAAQGPMSPRDALAAASAHHYIGEKDKARVAAEIEAGAAGPWHFSYGFQSVTLERVDPVQKAHQTVASVAA